MERPYKRPKRQAVSLTSLLDLLFVMIFVSLIQQKTVSDKVKPAKKTPTPVVKKTPSVFQLQATFNFYGTKENPSLPSGKYIMSGTFKPESKKLNLGGVAWIERPPQYDMVPLSGSIDSEKGIFTGRVESIGCKQFTLKRMIKRDKTPISGEWVGDYSCSQGKTGLTLTIE